MRAIATVLKKHSDGTALIEVMRKSACAGDCDSCHGCPHPEEHVRVRAQNPLDADVGCKVAVESDTAAVLGRASLLYLLPVVFMLVGLLIPLPSEEATVLAATGGLLLGLLVCFAATRKNRLKGLTFTITEILS